MNRNGDATKAGGKGRSGKIGLLGAIQMRRSIRAFSARPVPMEIQHSILEAATLAPSPKNCQPWRFVVFDRSDAIHQVADTLEETISRQLETKQCPNESISHLEGAKITAEILRKVPLLVFVCYHRVERDSNVSGLTWELTARPFEVADLQAIGAAIQNSLLQATHLGLGSLWLCDVLYAHDVIREKLSIPDPFIAAVAFGYVSVRGAVRKPLDEMVVRLSGVSW